MKKPILICCMLLYSLQNFAQPAFITDSLDTYITREMQRWNVPGLAVAIVKDGEVVISKGYGVRSMDSKNPVNENTLFQIASNTKAFTGTSLAILTEQGKIDLESRATNYLSYFKTSNPNITRMVTVEDLVSHRMGYETFQGDFLHWNSNLTRKEMVESIANQDFTYGFRDTYGYCNVGFVAAGEIIQEVTDTIWDDYITHHFFEPLEMKRSSTHADDIMHDNNAAVPHTIVDNTLITIPYANIDNLGPAASINSSVNDLSHWLIMQLNNGKYKGRQVVSEKALRNSYTSRTIVQDVRSNFYKDMHFNTYGLGWFLADYKGRRVIWHDGGANGFVTSVCFIPEENLGIIVLTNTDANSLYDALRMQIIEAYFEMNYRNLSEFYYMFTQPAEEEKWNEIHEWQEIAKQKNLPEEAIEAYEGTYYNKVYGEVYVKLDANDNLEISFPHHQFMQARLEPMGGNAFLCTFSDPIYGIHKVTFAFEQGREARLTLKVNDFVDMQPYDFIKQ